MGFLVFALVFQDGISSHFSLETLCHIKIGSLATTFYLVKREFSSDLAQGIRSLMIQDAAVNEGKHEIMAVFDKVAGKVFFFDH